MIYFVALAILLQIKHWYIDFVLQTDEMVKGKGIYGNLQGILHSLQHGIATFALLLVFAPDLAFSLAFLDFATHYHIDFIKVRFGCRDITKKAFWVQLGLDQLAHQITYILMLVVIIAV